VHAQSYRYLEGIVSGPTVRLEPFAEGDFDRLIAWSPTPEFLLQWAGPAFTFPLDHPQLEKHLAASRQDPPVSLAFRGVDATSGEVIGHIEMSSIDLRNRSARLGRVLVGPERLRGRGVGQQLVKAALAVAFDELCVHRVELYVFDFNKAAIACYERVGFQHEGTLREARKNGDVYWNLCVMSILEHERASEKTGSTGESTPCASRPLY
jgi:RimJ/RimL family protein N-acetyltransferase